MFREPIVLLYIGVFISALALAIYRRKTFPLGESLAVMLIVGIGFTLLVHFVVPEPAIPTSYPSVGTGEIPFVLVYLIVLAMLLTRDKPMPASWREHFGKEKIATLIFKFTVFVLIPFSALFFVWNRDFPNLGLSTGNLFEQVRISILLIFILGGFNLIAGSGAAPLRAKEFSARQILAGGSVAFVWMIFEVGLVEEFFFRAFLQTRLVGFFGSAASGIVAASLLFGLAHVPGLYLRAADKSGPLGEKPLLVDAVLYAILVLSPTGWFMGLLFLRTGSLLAPILVHAGLDAVAATADFIRGFHIRR